MNIHRPKLSISEKLCYGLGHVLNDFTASMWFSYLLIFLHRVVSFKSKTAGYMILIGQIVDAASTVLLGFLSDKTKNGICHYGRRKSWHLLGVICVLMSFPFSFNLCLTCSGESATSELIQFIYYIPFCVIFQFGWACSQISHLALIPELSRDETERVSLNSIRYAFTVMSNLFVYIATFITLRVNIGESASEVVRTSRSSGSEAMVEDASTQLTRADAPKFTFLSGIVCIVGLFTQIVFHLGTRENKRRRSCSIAPPPLPASSMATIADAEAAAMKQPPVNVTMVDLKHDWRDYMKSSRFYMVALLYMSTRLIINLCQIYMPMYLTDSVELNKHSIALIPLICYLSGFISTFPLSQITKVFHSCKTCLFGICLIIICCLLFWCHEMIYDKTVNAIVASIILGIGSTVISVTSLSIISELIGDKIASSAFVYGIMSFTDKISSGVAVVFLEEFSPCQINSQAASCKQFYFYVMSLFPLLCCFFSIIALVVLHLQISSKIKDFKKVNPLDDISKKELQKY